MWRKFLVPLDGSSLAECVLPHVIALAGATDAEIVLLHVLAHDGAADLSSVIDPLSWQMKHEEAQAYLNAVCDRLQAVGLRSETVLLEDGVADSIVDFARQSAIDLIILSSHGQSGLSRWNISGVVQKVIFQAPTSVMLIRAYQPCPATWADLRYQRVLVPLDGSQRAEVVLPVLQALVQHQSVRPVLAHVVLQPALPRHTPLTTAEKALVKRLVEVNFAEAQQYLHQLNAHLPTAVETRIVVSDNVTGTLHQLAETEAIDLVLLSAHGYASQSRYPFGSVATSFLLYSATPLLIIQDMPPETIAPSQAERAAEATTALEIERRLSHYGQANEQLPSHRS